MEVTAGPLGGMGEAMEQTGSNSNIEWEVTAWATWDHGGAHRTGQQAKGDERHITDKLLHGKTALDT